MTQISERCWQAGTTSGTGRGDSERNGAGRLVALAGKVTREGAGRLVALAGEKKLEKNVFFFLPSSVINYVGGIPRFTEGREQPISWEQSSVNKH